MRARMPRQRGELLLSEAKFAAAPLRRSDRFRRAMEGNKIRDESGLIVPMRFSESQDLLWNYVAPALDAGEQLWFIVLKARQIYATTFFENLTFTRTLEKPNTNSLVIAQDLDSAAEIFNMAKRFYDYLPLPKIKPPKVKELNFPFAGGASKFRVVSAGTAAKGRGTTQTCVHCSEVAFWPHPEVLTGLFQAMPDSGDTLWVLESTANGIVGNGSMFYEQWKAAISGTSKLVPVFIPWFIMSKYRMPPAVPESEWDEEEKILVEQFSSYGLDGESLRWRRYAIETKCEGMAEMFHQEYPSTPEEAFISTGLPAFDPLAILRQADNVRPASIRGTMSRGKFLKQSNGEIQLWQEPREGRQYVIGVDTSEGIKGGDYGCAQILDMAELEQVGIIHGFIQLYEMARLLNEAGRWYNNALVNIEVKGSGLAVQDYLLRQFQYPHLHPWKGRPDKIRMREPRHWGWDTNVASRPLLIESGRRALNSGLATIHDAATLQEIREFSRQDDGKYEARVGHDDRVMALLLALRSREENYSPIRSLVTSINVSEPDFSTLGVRVLDASEPMGLRHIHRALKQRARASVKSWLEM